MNQPELDFFVILIYEIDMVLTRMILVKHFQVINGIIRVLVATVTIEIFPEIRFLKLLRISLFASIDTGGQTFSYFLIHTLFCISCSNLESTQVNVDSFVVSNGVTNCDQE